MAKIPQGAFGNVLPQVQQTATVNTDGGMAAAQQHLSHTVQGISDRLNAQADFEKRQQDAADKAEAIRISDRNEKVATVTAHSNIQNGLADSLDQITSDVTAGKIDNLAAMAAWKDVSSKVIEDNLKAVPEALRPVVNADVIRFAGQLNNKLTDTFRANDQKQVGAGIQTYLEQQERLGRSDPALAIEQAHKYIDQFGGDAGMNPEQQAKTKQAISEKIRYTQAYSLISSTRDSIGGLEGLRKRLSTDEFLDVDPQKRAALDNTINTRITTLGQRAEAQAAAADRKRAAAFTSFNTFMESGRVPTPEYAVQTATMFKGTAYEGAVQAMLKDGSETAGFASASVQKQQQILLSESSKLNAGGSDPTLNKRFQKLQSIHDATMAAIKEDPLTASVDRNVNSTLAPIALDLKTLPQQLQIRQDAADRASAWTGKPVAPLTKGEAEQLATMLESLGPREKAAALKGVSDVVGGKSMQALAVLMGDKHAYLATAVGLAGSYTTQGRYVAEIYLDGKNVLKEGRAKMDAAKETGTKAQIYTALDGVYPTQKAKDQAADVIFSVYASKKATGDDNLNEAIKLATGGVTKYNGANVALPWGKSESDLRDAIKAVTPDTLRSQGDSFRVGGASLTPEQLAKQLPNLPLQTVGNGVYAVRVGGIPVMRENGRPLVLNLGGGDVR
ncbi:hypothetical protein [Herbaspirillum autotrophicum]|uniref:hypothetical protein n=1 Tax=Herbaspirillum autotrophicum TaxID=180195 RepID=UPI00067D7256|nr:hypothetical protein [Herbaspirillum autotrophicum]